MDECTDCGPDLKRGDVIKRHRGGTLYFVCHVGHGDLRAINLTDGNIWSSDRLMTSNFGDYSVVECCYKILD